MASTAQSSVIEDLRQHEAALRASGMSALYLFGSVARGEDFAESDVDLFFDLDRIEGFTLFKLGDLKERLEAITGRRVDLMTRAAIHPRRRPVIERQAVQVF